MRKLKSVHALNQPCNRAGEEGCFRRFILLPGVSSHVEPELPKGKRVVRQTGTVCPLSQPTSEWKRRTDQTEREDMSDSERRNQSYRV